MIKPTYICVILILSFLPASENVLYASEKAPFFSLPIQGTEKHVTLEGFRGKIVVLDFFSAGCGKCFRSSWEIELGIQEFYADRSGNPHGIPVQVVGISSEVAGPEDMNAFIRETGLALVLDDSEGNLLKQYGGATVPYLVVIDTTEASGSTPPRILYRSSGFESLEKLHEAIDAVTGRAESNVFQSGTKIDTAQVPAPSSLSEAVNHPQIHETTLDLSALTASDVFVTDTLAEYHQKSPFSEFTLIFSHRHMEADFKSEYLRTSRDKELKEDRFGIQGSASYSLNEILALKFNGGAYDGFQTYRALWLDEYYRLKFDALSKIIDGLSGYREAHPWGYNVSSGLRWEYIPGAGFADLSIAYQHDVVSPGYEVGLPIIRLRDTYDTISGHLAFENVLTRRLRTMLECRIDDTTARDPRITLQGALNYAPAENWVMRLAVAYAAEDPDFTSKSASAVLERDWHGIWFVGVFGRYYEDTSEIVNGIARNAAAPPLETYQAGFGLRRQGKRTSFKFVIGPCFSRYELHPLRNTAFDQLYKDRDWLSLQIAFLHQF